MYGMSPEIICINYADLKCCIGAKVQGWFSV